MGRGTYSKRRRPRYLDIVVPFAVDGVVLPVTVELFRVPSGLLTSLEGLGVRLVVKGIREHRDHKQVDDKAGGNRKVQFWYPVFPIECAGGTWRRWRGKTRGRCRSLPLSPWPQRSCPAAIGSFLKRLARFLWYWLWYHQYGSDVTRDGPPWSYWRGQSGGTSCVAWWSHPPLPHPVSIVAVTWRKHSKKWKPHHISDGEELYRLIGQGAAKTCSPHHQSEFTCIRASLFPNQGTTVPRATAAWRILVSSFFDISNMSSVCQFKTKAWYWRAFHLVRNVHEVVDPKADGHHRDEECKEELQHFIFQELLSLTKRKIFWQKFIFSS